MRKLGDIKQISKDEYYHLKSEASANGQAALTTTYKLLLNSLYGSFAKKAIYPMGI